LNSYFPHFLADVTSDIKTMVVHMSTDCVFSGKKGAYSENDLRDGETFYDRSKALDEPQDGKNVTLRNSIVGPDMNPRGIGLFNWFMQQKGEISGYTRAMWTGQTTLQLAKTMEAAVREGATGLYNMVPDKAISKYDLLRLFNRHLRNNSITISPIDMNAFDKSLKRTHFDFPYIIPDYEEMVAQMSDWIRRHAALYPHYKLQEVE
jgi:dTDP-4-dehydrorhamnose reductase